MVSCNHLFFFFFFPLFEEVPLSHSTLKWGRAQVLSLSRVILLSLPWPWTRNPNITLSFRKLQCSLLNGSCGNEDPAFPGVFPTLPPCFTLSSFPSLDGLTATYSLSATVTLGIFPKYMCFFVCAWSMTEPPGGLPLTSTFLPSIQRPWEMRPIFNPDIGDFLHYKVNINTNTTQNKKELNELFIQQTPS